MRDKDDAKAELKNLKSGERSMLLSFLSLSERRGGPEESPLDALALSIALNSARNGAPN